MIVRPAVVVGFAVGIALACVDDGRCGGGGTASVCPPPSSGFAVVEGTVVDSEGSPLSGKQVYVSCGSVVGAYDQRTNARGAFRIALTYGSLEGPPPLDGDGMFRLTCRVFAVGLTPTGTVTVPFAPTRDAVIPVSVVLQESR
jgi:hypothetical protein